MPKSLKKKRQTGGDTICSNLFPKLPSKDPSLVTNETIGGPAPVSSSDNVLSCSIPTPRAPVGPTPPEPMLEQMPMDGTPSTFLGNPPPRRPPVIPGPPGPGNYKPGLAGIPVLGTHQKPPQATSILKELVNQGTFNKDYQPILNTNLVSNSTCKSNPNNRSQVGGSVSSPKKKKSLKIIKSPKLLKEQDKKLDKEREEIFVNGIKKNLSVDDFKKILDFLKIKYDKDLKIDRLFMILKKERPDLVSGTGWFYLLNLIRDLIDFTKWSLLVSLLLATFPFIIVYNNAKKIQKTKRLKKTIRKIIDSAKK